MDKPRHQLPGLEEVSAGQRRRTLTLCVLGWMFDHYDLILFAYIAGAIGTDWEWGDAFKHNKGLLLGVALFCRASVALSSAVWRIALAGGASWVGPS